MRDAFHSLFDQAAGLPAEERAVALAFACGYAAHLCLDAEAHPWVMYWTGDITERADPAQRVLAFQRRRLLESSIDVMLRQQRSADPAWIRRSRLLRMSRAQTAIVARAFERMMDDVHNVAFSAAEGRAAFRDMAFVYSAMSDRHAPLARLLTLLAPVVDRSGVMDRTQLYPDDPLPLVVDLARARGTAGSGRHCRTNRARRRSRRSSSWPSPRARAVWGRWRACWTAPAPTRPPTRSATATCSPGCRVTTRGCSSPSLPHLEQLGG